MEQERDRLERRAARQRVRRGMVAVLVVVGIASFTAAAAGWWVRRNVADTEVWMERVGPLAEDPAVQAALSTWLSDEVLGLIDARELFAEVLPERGRLLAVPLSAVVENFVRDRIDRFVASDRFERLWLAANETAHRAAVRVLRGESDVVQAHDGAVVINLVPVVDAALEDIGSASPEVLGRQVDLPDLTVDDLPAAAIDRLETALGVRLDDDFGQFVVYDRGRLTALQEGLDQARRWLVVLSVTTVATLGAALWLSGRRRRTAIQIVVGLVVGIAVIRRLGIRGQRELLAMVPDDLNRAAAEAVSDRFLEPLLATTETLLVLLAVLGATLVLSGPYPWAVRLRRRLAEMAGGLPGHRAQLQVGGAALAVLVVLAADLSFVGLAAVAGMTALGWILLDRIPDEAGDGRTT